MIDNVMLMLDLGFVDYRTFHSSFRTDTYVLNYDFGKGGNAAKPWSIHCGKGLQEMRLHYVCLSNI
jgi:hypothetical protein